MGPRAGLDTEAREKILSPLPGIECGSPGRPARSQTLYWLSYPAHESQKREIIKTTVYSVDVFLTVSIMPARATLRLSDRPCGN
jgi:hypothetical protein